MLRPSFRILAAAFCLALAGFSLASLQTDLETLGTRAAAQRLNLGEPLTAASIEALAAGPEFDHALGQCRSSVLDHALVIQLNRLDNINRATDDDGWQKAIGRTQQLVEKSERCKPGDGNLWLRDAMLVRAVAEVPEAVAMRLALSSNLIPTYMPVVQVRVAQWALSNPDTQAAGQDTIESDLRTMVLYFPPYQTAAIINSLPEPMKSKALSFIPLTSPARRERLLLALSQS
jgi:hypothetical protein